MSDDRVGSRLAGIVDELLRGSLEDSFERLRHRFISAIHTLPVEQATLLLDVFALSRDTQDVPELMQRRQIHGEKIGRKVDTVRTRETAALKALHSRLVTGRYAHWHLNTARTATEPMQDRTRYDLRFRITPPEDGSEPEPITLAGRALHHRALLFTIRVGFVGEVPASVWKFEGASPFACPHAANEYNRVQFDARDPDSPRRPRRPLQRFRLELGHLTEAARSSRKRPIMR